jgi:hypothetical protein
MRGGLPYERFVSETTKRCVENYVRPEYALEGTRY